MISHARQGIATQWAEVAVVISSPDDENRCGSSLVQAGAFLYPSVDGGDKHRGAT